MWVYKPINLAGFLANRVQRVNLQLLTVCVFIEFVILFGYNILTEVEKNVLVLIIIIMLL